MQSRHAPASVIFDITGKESGTCLIESMLEFVCFILPGVFFAYAAEFMMRQKKINVHRLVFLSVTNILVLTFAVLALRNFIGDFLTADTYNLAIGSMDHAEAVMKQLIFSACAGVPLCLVEAFLAKHLSLGLETQEDGEAK